MGNQTCPEGPVRQVPQSELPAGLVHQRRKGLVMDLANAEEEVVLDLEVQPVDEPGKQPTTAGEIDGRLNLVFGPALLYPARVLPGEGKAASSTQCAN